MTDKWAIARTLDEISKYIELSETNPFKSRAFARAARAVEAAEEDVASLVRQGRILELPNIGKAIGPIITELVHSGRSGFLEELRSQYPPNVFDLLRVPGLGLKKAKILYETLGIGDLDALETAARDGRIARLKGFGAATQAKILSGIATARKPGTRFLLPRGLEIGESLREQLATIPEILDAEVTGAVRRRLEVLDTVEVAVSTREPERVVDAIRSRALLDRVELLDASTMAGVAREETPVVVHLAGPSDFGAAVLVTTGSAPFVEALAEKAAGAGFELRDKSVYRRGKHVGAGNERDLFARLEVPWVDPEIREGAEVLRTARRPRLVEPADLRGTFHIHSTYSDGRNTILEMLSAARERGFDYAGISDHSQNAFYARGLTEQDLARQHAEIEGHRAAVAPMRVFRGTEADILNDGSIDYGPRILATFDFVIASVHSRFGMSPDEMTERLLRALDDPFVTFLGHLTGRLLLSREGYSFDFDKIFDRAAARGVMIEINGNPNRAELDWRLIRKATDRGVTLSIHPDAHSVRELSHVVSGTWVARKGGLSAKQVFNCRPVDEVAEFLAKRRAKAIANAG